LEWGEAVEKVECGKKAVEEVEWREEEVETLD
jgi:hypothetical protein